MGKNIARKDGMGKVLLFILAFFLLSVGCAVFGILYLTELQAGVIARNIRLFSALYGGIIALFFVVSIYFPLTGKDGITRFFFSAYLLFFFFIAVLYVLEKTGLIILLKDAERLQKYLESAGVWMPIAYIILQFLQVIVLPIPSIVSTMVGTALFGPLGATIYSLIGILLGSYFAFFLGRKLGCRAVSWMVGKEVLDKWQKKLKGKDNVVLTLMFFLPLFPDDVLCIVAGLSTMSIPYFFWVITISRIIGIVGTCYSVNFIPLNTWWGMALWIVFFIAMLLLFFAVYKNLGKIQERARDFRKKKSGKDTFKE